MYCIQASIEAKKNQGNSLEQHLAELTKTSRSKPTCLSYTIYRQTHNPDGFISIEHWESKEAFKAHLGSDCIAEYQSQTKDILKNVSLVPLANIDS